MMWRPRTQQLAREKYQPRHLLQRLQRDRERGERRASRDGRVGHHERAHHRLAAPLRQHHLARTAAGRRARAVWPKGGGGWGEEPGGEWGKREGREEPRLEEVRGHREQRRRGADHGVHRRVLGRLRALGGGGGGGGGAQQASLVQRLRPHLRPEAGAAWRKGGRSGPQGVEGARAAVLVPQRAGRAALRTETRYLHPPRRGLNPYLLLAALWILPGRPAASRASWRTRRGRAGGAPGGKGAP